jgi:curved DNA-binding protein CbpA
VSRLDYYEVLQINRKAEPETIRRVYRLLARRYHPDNPETGDADQFRLLGEAYAVLSDVTRRAEYDSNPELFLPDPEPEAPEPVATPHDFEFEQLSRLAVLEVLYLQRRTEPGNAFIYDADLEQKLGVSRERLEFTIWYLREKGYVRRAAESSRLGITAEGAEFLERHHTGNFQRRLYAARQSS